MYEAAVVVDISRNWASRTGLWAASQNPNSIDATSSLSAAAFLFFLGGEGLCCFLSALYNCNCFSAWHWERSWWFQAFFAKLPIIAVGREFQFSCCPTISIAMHGCVCCLNEESIFSYRRFRLVLNIDFGIEFDVPANTIPTNKKRNRYDFHILIHRSFRSLHIYHSKSTITTWYFLVVY